MDLLSLFKQTDDKNVKKTNQTSEGIQVKQSSDYTLTLQDLIAPKYIELDFNHIQINKRYYRIFMVVEYPRTVGATWLAPLINFDASLAVSMFYYPVDTDKILDKLKKKIAELEASLMTEHQAGKVLDPKNKVALQDAQKLIDDIAAGNEKFFNAAIYIRIQADTKKELDLLTKSVTSTMAAIGLTVVPTTLQMDDGFKSTLPLALDKIYKVRNMDSTSIARTFPFVTSDLTMDHGILYGINMHNHSLVIFDRFSMPNPNEVVFATSGAGKSYYVKLQALRYLLTGTQILIIDPENEYDKLAHAVDGAYITFSQDEGDKINPFEFLKSSNSEEKNILRDKILSLHTLLKLMMGGELTSIHTAILDKALILTYREKGITNNPDTWNNPPPLLEDLYKILKGMTEPQAADMAARIEKYVMGSAAGVFNKPTNIRLDNKFTVFSIRDLRDELRPIAMYLILDFIWTKIKEERRKRLLLIDEAWTMMQHEDSAKFIFGIAKRCRKYYLGLTIISQDVDEFLNSQYGKAVVTNSSMQMLLKQSTAAIDQIEEVFNLSLGEKNFLLNANVGEGLFFADKNHVAIRVISSKGENALINSDPKELEKMKKASNQDAWTDIDEAAEVYVH